MRSKTISSDLANCVKKLRELFLILVFNPVGDGVLVVKFCISGPAGGNFTCIYIDFFIREVPWSVIFFISEKRDSCPGLFFFHIHLLV